MLNRHEPALVLAPMDGVTDAPMRSFQGATGSFTYAVSEFLRVSQGPLPARVFLRDVPELATGSRTSTGLLVHPQILGGDPDAMALSAVNAVRAGALAVDLNFGCPAPTVNRNDGGATLLKYPCRIRDIVSAVRSALPPHVPVSAKLRLGWDSIDTIDETAAMAEEGGAAWLTIHARTRLQGYAPPVYWEPVARVRARSSVPVVANGDIWSLEDFHRCQDVTGCRHFMIGRGALADPSLSYAIACELGLSRRAAPPVDWPALFRQFLEVSPKHNAPCLGRLKQWSRLAHRFGDFPCFDAVKQCETLESFFEILDAASLAPVA